MDKEDIEKILNSEDDNVAFFIATDGEIGEEVTKEEFKKWFYNKKEKKESISSELKNQKIHRR